VKKVPEFFGKIQGAIEIECEPSETSPVFVDDILAIELDILI